MDPAHAQKMCQQKEKLRRGGLEGIKSLYIGFGLIKGLSMNLGIVETNRAREQSNVHNLGTHGRTKISVETKTHTQHTFSLQ